MHLCCSVNDFFFHDSTNELFITHNAVDAPSLSHVNRMLIALAPLSRHHVFTPAPRRACLLALTLTLNSRLTCATWGMKKNLNWRKTRGNCDKSFEDRKEVLPVRRRQIKCHSSSKLTLDICQRTVITNLKAISDWYKTFFFVTFGLFIWNKNKASLEPYLRSLHHLGRSSEAKDRKKNKQKS